jgi:hypothetical protein
MGVMTTDDALTSLSGWTDDEIAQDDVRATGVLYAAAALEELKLIELVDRLNELNQNKLLSIGAGQASNLLHEFWNNGFRRLQPRRRAALYVRVFGAPAADGVDAEPNSDFPDLWLRFVTALAERSDAIGPAATALHDNLAEHTDEQSTKAAIELRTTLTDVAEALSDMELRTAYRAEDMWQLVAAVGDEQFCGERDIERARTLAATGAAILRRLPELAADPAVADDELAEAAAALLAAGAQKA